MYASVYSDRYFIIGDEYATTSYKGIDMNLVQFKMLCSHVEEIRKTVTEFRKFQYETEKQNAFGAEKVASGSGGDKNMANYLLREATVHAIQQLLPKNIDYKNRALVKIQIDEIIGQKISLSGLVQTAYDRHKRYLGDFKLAFIEQSLKRFFGEAGIQDLVDALCEN